MDTHSEGSDSGGEEGPILMTVNAVAGAVMEYSSSFYNKEAYHTSALTGQGWVSELLNGHPDRIKCELGVRLQVFQILINTLKQQGYNDSNNVTLEEQLSIFLYTCVTGLTVPHVAERFQRAGNTITRYLFSL
jgi:hypothetical protein